jgi:hypothetical protein
MKKLIILLMLLLYSCQAYASSDSDKEMYSSLESKIMQCRIVKKKPKKEDHYYLCRNDNIICYLYYPYSMDKLLCLSTLEVWVLENQMGK